MVFVQSFHNIQLNLNEKIGLTWLYCLCSCIIRIYQTWFQSLSTYLVLLQRITKGVCRSEVHKSSRLLMNYTATHLRRRKSSPLIPWSTAQRWQWVRHVWFSSQFEADLNKSLLRGRGLTDEHRWRHLPVRTQIVSLEALKFALHSCDKISSQAWSTYT